MLVVFIESLQATSVQISGCLLRSRKRHKAWSYLWATDLLRADLVKHPCCIRASRYRYQSAQIGCLPCWSILLIFTSKSHQNKVNLHERTALDRCNHLGLHTFVIKLFTVHCSQCSYHACLLLQHPHQKWSWIWQFITAFFYHQKFHILLLI